MCIFKHVLGRLCKIKGHPAPTKLLRLDIRPKENRPCNIDEWYLTERMEIEVNATLALSSVMRNTMYNLTDEIPLMKCIKICLHEIQNIISNI